MAGHGLRANSGKACEAIDMREDITEARCRENLLSRVAKKMGLHSQKRMCQVVLGEREGRREDVERAS